VCDVIVVVVEAWLTVWDNDEEVLPVKLLSALYVAVIECPPTASVVVVRAAVLPVRLTVATVAAPSLNVTVPVGVPAPGATAATVAVKVSDWPKTDGFGPVVRATVVVVLAWFTTWVRVLEVLVPKLASPPYTAVIECEATESAAVANVATPDPLSVPVPSVVAPSLNVTVPVGVPPLPVTVAVKVTDCPNTEGFCEDVSVVVLGLTTTRVAVVVTEPPLQLEVLAPASAFTVNVDEPAGVAPVVLIVKVEVWLLPVLVTGLGLNAAVAPVGSPVVTLSVAEQPGVPLPLKFTVTGYVVEFPTITGLVACAPTVTL